jgi:predicted TIM-barrel fold metal-dependent hydrolase
MPGHDRYLVVSADGHAGPPAARYREYLDPAYREAFDEHQAALADLREATKAARENTEFVARWEEITGGDGGLTAAYDSDRRDRVLDDEGVAAEVLFPDADVLGTGRVAQSPFGSGLGGAMGMPPDQALAGARAHNRWLADFVAESPPRRVGVAIVPLHDVDDACAEIARAHDAGLRGALIPTRWFDSAPYHDPRYEPVWDALEERSMVLHTHSGAGPTEFLEGPGAIAIYATEAYWWAARPLWVLLWSGVFERHPGLRYVIAENGAWWAPDILAKMDEKYLGGHNTEKLGNVFTEHLSMKPSEYFDRSCWLAASTPGVEDMARRTQIGVGNVLWGNDLPHPEGTFPFTRHWIRERFRDVPPDEARRMLGENALGVYGLDRGVLAAIAERIGPTADEVHGDAPLARVPA